MKTGYRGRETGKETDMKRKKKYLYEAIKSFDNVLVYLKDQTMPYVFERVQRTYIEADMYCVLAWSGKIYKYPTINIATVVEDPVWKTPD